MTIHIVEDDPGVSDALTTVLRQLGHEARAYPDAESLFGRQPPGPSDIIIVDLGLPGISGAALIRWLYELARPPRVICISGRPKQAIQRDLSDLAGLAVLRKPLTPDALLAAL